MFKFICDSLLPNARIQSFATTRTCFGRKKFGMSLYFLASCCVYRMTGNQFGAHKATVRKHLHQFVDTVINILLPKCIYKTNLHRLAEI